MEYRQSVSEVVAALRTDAQNGLDSDEARARLERLGTNQLTAEKTTPASKSLPAQFRNRSSTRDRRTRNRPSSARARRRPWSQARWPRAHTRIFRIRCSKQWRLESASVESFRDKGPAGALFLRIRSD